MTTLGIDQSYSGFGFVVYFYDNVHRADLGKWDPKKFGTGVDRLLAIEYWIKSRFAALGLSEYDVEHVAMEGYANGAKFGREQAGELGATVKRALLEIFDTGSCPPVAYPTIVPPSALKKFVTGKGNATKDQMMLATYKKWGVEFTDNNLCDAYGLARLAATYELGTDLKYEQEVLDALTVHTERRI